MTTSVPSLLNRPTRHLARLSMVAVVVGSLVGGFTVLASSGTAGASGNFYVSSYGSDTNPCTSNAPCLTLKHTLNVASSGSTIHLAGGTFIGNLDVKKSINIVGTSSGGSLEVVTSTISGNGGIWGLEIANPGVSVTISDVVVTGASADAIENHGVLVLNDVNLQDSYGDDNGSGMFSGDSVVMNGGSISENAATEGTVGGGFDIDGGTATFHDVSFEHNTAVTPDGEGGAIFNYFGTVHLTGDTSIHDNSAALEGGGILTCPGQTTTIGPDVSVTNNTPNNISSSDPAHQCA
jgi:hypothetical protein